MKNFKYDVSIVIPVYNSKDTIKETIESIQKQQYCGDIYINIIDDGSTDGSLDMLKSMDFDSKIKLIESQHIGKAYALNKVYLIYDKITLKVYKRIFHPKCIKM